MLLLLAADSGEASKLDCCRLVTTLVQDVARAAPVNDATLSVDDCLTNSIQCRVTTNIFSQPTSQCSYYLICVLLLCHFCIRKCVLKRYQRCCCCASSWGSCCYQIFRVLRLCRFSTDRYETVLTYQRQYSA